MDILPYLVAALVLLPAIGSSLWAWRSFHQAETALRVEAGLDKSDFDIGTWPASARFTSTTQG